MICLDTNYLILGLVPGSTESVELIGWAQSSVPLVTSSVAWYEFLCGPVSEQQVTVMQSFLAQIIPFGETEGKEAANLFNSTGRRRALRVDAMIAATAIVAGAKLATNNRGDFAHFE